MSDSTTKQAPFWQREIPAVTSELIKHLDAEIPKMPFKDVRDLADSEGERARIELAITAGQRELVDRLKSLLKRT